MRFYQFPLTSCRQNTIFAKEITLRTGQLVLVGLASGIARIFLGILGAVSLAIGVRIAYTTYSTEKVLARCIAGGSCPLDINSLALQSAYETARGEIILGAALAVIGVLMMMYSFLFAGRSTSTRLVQTGKE